jgi:hypothetical protein
MRHLQRPLISLRPLLLLLAWLLALLPAGALASIPRNTFNAPALPLASVPSATSVAAGEPVALLTLHLDGLYEGGVLVRQNPWSAFDPEGLYTATEMKEIGKANIVNTGIMLKGMVWDFPKNTLEGISTAFWHPIATCKAVGSQFKSEVVTLATDPKKQMASYGNTLKQIATDPKTLGETGAAVLVSGGVTKMIPKGVDMKVAPSARHFVTEPHQPGYLPSEAPVVRGGSDIISKSSPGANTPAGILKGTATIPEGTPGAGLTGFSAESAAGATAEALAAPLKNTSYGATTVGAVTQAGGDVVPTPRAYNTNHVTVTGLTPENASELLTPTVKKKP